VRFTDCYLLKTRQNKTECHNSFNNKYLTLCVLCALCGFEKSGLSFIFMSTGRRGQRGAIDFRVFGNWVIKHSGNS
jgi:hypothetical protein